MTDTVASFTSYLALQQQGIRIASETSYLPLLIPRAEIASQTSYLALCIEPRSSRRRRQIIG